MKHWITFNEPHTFAVYGYARGEHAPGRSRKQTREPCVAAHYVLLAHAYAVARYRSEFQPRQRGLISIALNSDWREPASDAPADLQAAQRSMEFNLGWFADPLYLGDYPPTMRERIGNRLPVFTPEQQALLVNSSDFFALQHYSTLMVSMRPDGELDRSSFYADEGVRYHQTQGARKNVLGWDIAPFGFHRLLKWVAERYRPSGGIVVTENGLPLHEESATAARHDLARVCYLKQYLAQAGRAMREGWTCAATLCGRCSTTSSGRRAPRRASGSSMWTLPRSDAPPRGRPRSSRSSPSHAFTYTPSECNATASVHSTFVAEAAQLQRIVNQSSEQRQQTGQAPTAAVRRTIVTRASRLAQLADVQARHSAEQGEFKAMRAWQAKAEKMRTFAERQRALSSALSAAAAAAAAEATIGVARCSGGGRRGTRRAAEEAGRRPRGGGGRFAGRGDARPRSRPRRLPIRPRSPCQGAWRPARSICQRFRATAPRRWRRQPPAPPAAPHQPAATATSQKWPA